MKAKIITVNKISPDVHFSNYMTVEPGTAWGPRRMPDFELILLDCVWGI